MHMKRSVLFASGTCAVLVIGVYFLFLSALYSQRLQHKVFQQHSIRDSALDPLESSDDIMLH